MPRALLAAFGLAALADCRSHAMWQWRLAPSGQSCSSACHSTGNLKCMDGHWPTDGHAVEEIASTVAFSCSPTEITTLAMGPAVHDYGKCVYPKYTSVTCEATPPKHWRRLCPCGSSDKSFIMADQGSTCTEACISRGGLCESNVFAWPRGRQDLEDAVQKAGGGTCAIMTISSEGYAPFVDGDICYLQSDPASMDCDAYSPLQQRVCPCMGVKPASTAVPFFDDGSPLASASNHSDNSSADEHTKTDDSGEGAAPASGSAEGGAAPASGSAGGGATTASGSATWSASAAVTSADSGAGCLFAAFRRGKAIGGTQDKLPAMYVSSVECKEAVMAQCPKANGATYSPGLGDCWCDLGMSGLAGDAVKWTCMFLPPTSTATTTSVTWTGSSTTVTWTRTTTTVTSTSVTTTGSHVADGVDGDLSSLGIRAGATGAFLGSRDDVKCHSDNFRQGSANGGKQKKFSVSYANQVECMKAVIGECLAANGATFSPDTGDCWCNIGMTGYKGDDSLRTCWFESSSAGTHSGARTEEKLGFHTSIPGCRGGAFQLGYSISDGKQSQMTATFVSADMCKAAVREQCPTANGATFSPSLGECWCNLGMSGYVPQPTLSTCWFDGTAGDVGIVDTFHKNNGPHSVPQSGNSAYLAPAKENSGCQDGDFHRGQTSSGGFQRKKLATYVSAFACEQAVREECPTANGATWAPSLGECWCNMGMTGYEVAPTKSTCWFTGAAGKKGVQNHSSGAGSQSDSNHMSTPKKKPVIGHRNSLCRGGAYHEGQTSYGGSQSKFLATFATADGCLQAVKTHCPTANGATYAEGMGECWCNMLMTGFDIDPTMSTCWFKDGNDRIPRLWNVGGFLHERSLIPILATSALLAGLLGGILAGLLVWRHSRAAPAGAQGDDDLLLLQECE